jgi:3alpha(or 20beta)-hydroxysteroid dehydrogenase
MGRLEGKTALITGGARGQGAAEARLFAREGARVLVADVLEEPGEAVAEELGERGCFVRLDVGAEQDWSDAVRLAGERFGSLDILINNAGVLQHEPLVDLALDDYLEVIRVNQVGCFLGMRTVAPAMRDAGGGSIVNVSSLSGLRGSRGTLSYTASKFAVRGMTKVAALELGEWGIRVNSLHPGGVRTPMVAEASAKLGITSVDEFYEHLPVGRIGEPEDIARVALFLASDDSGYCTGSEFVVDGGEMAGTS